MLSPLIIAKKRASASPRNTTSPARCALLRWKNLHGSITRESSKHSCFLKGVNASCDLKLVDLRSIQSRVESLQVLFNDHRRSVSVLSLQNSTRGPPPLSYKQLTFRKLDTHHFGVCRANQPPRCFVQSQSASYVPETMLTIIKANQRRQNRRPIPACSNRDRTLRHSWSASAANAVLVQV